MARIGIVSQCLVTGDAVSNDVLGMREVLLAAGHDVDLFADSWHVSQPEVGSVGRLQRFVKDPKAVLVYHHAVGWDLGIRILQKAACRKVVRYHNVTPAEFFDGVDADVAARARLGRAQLPVLAGLRGDLYLSASAFNQGDLLATGADANVSFVVPPFHQVDRLESVEPDGSATAACRDGRTNVLFVGRVTPHKGHAALIDAFAVYHRLYNDRSRLVMVGKEGRPFVGYLEQLEQQVRRLGLENDVAFAGEASDPALKSYYATADAFMTASCHEGFCVPLVEAMAMKVPIVAFGCTAIPETVGEAGLVWEQPDPFLMAASLNRIVQNDTVRKELGQRGWRRYQARFSTGRIRERFMEAFERLPGL